VLLGRRDVPSLNITAFRWLDKIFAPTGADAPREELRQALAGLMAKVRWDSERAGLQLVGWFRAQTKADLSLSLQDLEIFGTFFKER